MSAGMCIVVDAMCAEFGGIRTYAEHMLDAWPEEFPDDEVHVLLRRGSTLPTRPGVVRHEVAVPRIGPAGRPLAQSIHLPRLVREVKADVVLATLPSTTLRRPAAPLAVVVYDLRHRLRPQQFSKWTRVFRAVSYRLGYRLADGIVSISSRSLHDLHRLHPRTSETLAVVAHLGADHVTHWTKDPVESTAVAFAHHSNKNLDLVLAGWKRLTETRRTAPPLTILGLDDAQRPSVAQHVKTLGLGHTVRLYPYVAQEELQRLLASAALIVFPSDFEGFGLPVAEGMQLGVPIVIGPELATQEVAGGHAHVMTDWTAEALASACDRALLADPSELEAARLHAEQYKWSSTAHSTRALLLALTCQQGTSRATHR